MASGTFQSKALHGVYGSGAGSKGSLLSMKPSFEDMNWLINWRLLISQLTIEFIILLLSVHLGLDIKEMVQVIRDLKL